MSATLITFLCDGGLAVLLMATIAYCARLSGRIRLLQDSKSELGEMIARFDQATGRAMASLAELQTVSKKITDALQIKIEKANFLADDLAFLIEKANKLAQAKEPAKHLTEPVKPAPAIPKPQFEAQFAKPQVSPAAAPAAHLSALEAVLQRLSAGSAPPAATKMPGTQPRTGAERELLEALKSGH